MDEIIDVFSLPVGIDQRIAELAPDIVAAAVAVAFVAFGTHCLSCQWRFGCSIAGQLVDFGDCSGIVAGIDGFRGFVALE